MRRPECTIELSVDGRECPPGAVYHHCQDDPYPGDHRYTLTLRGKGISGYALQYTGIDEIGTYERLNSEACHWLFERIARFLSGSDSNPASELLYVLNTVESLTATPDQMTLEGICSTFLRGGALREPSGGEAG